MTREETSQMLTLLKVAYPNFYGKMSQKDAYATLNLWAEMFADDDVNIVKFALHRLIETHTGYPPDIAEVKSHIRLLVQASTGEPTDEELWRILRRAAANGLYGSSEEYERLPPVLKRYCGSPSALREMAMQDEKTLDTVVRGLFLRQISGIQQRPDVFKKICITFFTGTDFKHPLVVAGHSELIHLPAETGLYRYGIGILRITEAYFAITALTQIAHSFSFAAFGVGVYQQIGFAVDIMIFDHAYRNIHLAAGIDELLIQHFLIIDDCRFRTLFEEFGIEVPYFFWVADRMIGSGIDHPCRVTGTLTAFTQTGIDSETVLLLKLVGNKYYLTASAGFELNSQLVFEVTEPFGFLHYTSCCFIRYAAGFRFAAQYIRDRSCADSDILCNVLQAYHISSGKGYLND